MGKPPQRRRLILQSKRISTDYYTDLAARLQPGRAISQSPVSAHAGKVLDGLGKVGNGFVCVAVLNAVPHAVVQMPFQHDLAHFVQSAFHCVDLDEHVFAGHVLIHHFIDGVDLTGNFFQPAVKVFCIHTLFHRPPAMFWIRWYTVWA